MANISKKTPPQPAPQVSTHTEENDMGTIQISDDVIAAVVRKYTLSVPGVARLVGQSIVGGLAGIIGKRIQDRAIRVEMDGERVSISVSIIVRFGEHVPTVATNVQNIVRKFVEELTGQQVGRVNVVVQNLEHEEQLEELPDEGEEPNE